VGSKKSSSKSSSKGYNKLELPGYINAASKAAVASGMSINERQYQNYDKDRMAELAHEEKMGISKARNAGEHYKPYFEEANTMYAGATRSWKDVDQSAYMNPYIDNVQTDTIGRMGDANEQRRAEIRGTAAQRDAFGSGRSDMIESKLDEDYIRSTGEYVNESNVAAYQSGKQTFEQENAMLAQVANAKVAQGMSAEAAEKSAYQTLMGAGQVKRALEQNKMNFDYLEFMEERDWDIRNLDVLVNTLAAVPYEKTERFKSKTKNESKTSGGGLGQVVGAVATVAAAYFTGGASLAAQAAASGASSATQSGGGVGSTADLMPGMA